MISVKNSTAKTRLYIGKKLFFCFSRFFSFFHLCQWVLFVDFSHHFCHMLTTAIRHFSVTPLPVRCFAIKEADNYASKEGKNGLPLIA